jgi:hypothetical protein
MKINDYVRFFEKLNDSEFPHSGHSVADSDVCTALTGCAECPSGQCCRNSGGCPRVFELANLVRSTLVDD